MANELTTLTDDEVFEMYVGHNLSPAEIMLEGTQGPWREWLREEYTADGNIWDLSPEQGALVAEAIIRHCEAQSR